MLVVGANQQLRSFVSIDDRFQSIFRAATVRCAVSEMAQAQDH